MSTTTQNRAPMNGYHRRTSRSAHPAVVGARVTLPPMEAFAGAPAELVLALTEWHDLATKALEHAREQRHALDAAERAAVEYRAAITEAVSKGTDPGKIRDKAPEHKAEAEAHAAAADAARSAQVRAGITLGPLLEEHAPTLYAPCEDELSKADAELRESLATVTASWRRWSAAFALRRWLSNVATNGTVPTYHGPDNLPAEVAQALAALDTALGSLDRLKADEAQVVEHRAAEAAAAAWARREYGTNKHRRPGRTPAPGPHHRKHRCPMRYLPTTAGDTRRGFDEGRRPALDKLPKALADKITERDRIKAQRAAALSRVADLGTEQRTEAARQADDDAAAKAARAGKPIPAPAALPKLEEDRAKAERAALAQETAFEAVHTECEDMAARLHWDNLEQNAGERAAIRAEIAAKAAALADAVEAAVDRWAVADWLHRGVYDTSTRTWPVEVMDLARYGLDRRNTTPVDVRAVIIAAATTCLDDPTD